MAKMIATKIALAAAAIALVAGGPAMAATKKPTKAASHTSAPADASADSLNAQSLAAAQAGKDFTPPASK